MSKYFLLLGAIALLFAVSIMSPNSSQSAGLPKLNPQNAVAIDRLLETAIANKELPGVVAAVVNKDRVLYLKAFGKQDVGKNIPMTKDTVFRIALISNS